MATIDVVRLTARLAELDLTQRAFARAAGFSEGTVRHLLKGKNVHTKTLRLAAAALKTKPAHLLAPPALDDLPTDLRVLIRQLQALTPAQWRALSTLVRAWTPAPKPRARRAKGSTA